MSDAELRKCEKMEMLSSQVTCSSFILYIMETMESRTHTFQTEEIRHEGFSGLATSHSAIPTPHEICLAHPASFQATKMNIDNVEKVIVKHTHYFYSVNQICELPSGANKTETDQQRNESRIKTLDENRIEVRNHLYIKSILAINPADRNAFERRAVTQHSIRLEENPLPQYQA